MAASIKGDSMGNISVGNGTLFIMAKGGEPMPLGDTIEVETVDDHFQDDHFQDDYKKVIGHICTSDEVTIDFTPNYLNQKLITELFFGITNNARRMHGGFALRERTRYKWYNKYKRNYSYD